VVISGATRLAIREHAEADAPNEACGLLVLREGIADRYVPGINEAASPYRFELRMPDPEVWFLEDDGYELAVFHSHPESPARPSKTDVENIGHWQGRPYVIYTLRTDELAAWRIEDGSIESLPLTES
jgi:proteasome lid subunit RPN8/RPN11